MTPAELIAFEDDITSEFEAGNIKAPVHLAGGNELDLIKIFKNIQPQDWVLCTWRAHYHCLLKGVPPQQVKQAILNGRSIALCFPEYRIFSSALVGGICPWAVGLAYEIKRRNDDERVYCFIGDMASEAGIFHECEKYSYSLPITWVIEDNRLSVCTDTKKAWRYGESEELSSVLSYRYRLTKPHVGIGKFVRF